MLLCKCVLVVIAGMIASSDTDSALFVALLLTCWWNAPSVRSKVPAVDVPVPLLIVVEALAKNQVHV